MYSIEKETDMLPLLLDLISCRLFSFDNQQSTIKGYLAAHQVLSQDVLRLGTDDIPLYDHCSEERHRENPRGVRKTIPDETAANVVNPISGVSCGDRLEGRRICNVLFGFALSYFLLCQASERFAFASGLLHQKCCLMHDCLTFFRRDV